MWNTLQIKQYQNLTFTHILSSQFVYSSLNQKCELKKQALIIENKKKKKLYYLYLFLTANKRPYVKKQESLSKNTKKFLMKKKTKSLTWKIEIKNSKSPEILTYMLFQIIPFQTNSERKILKLKENNLDLVIQYAPLTIRTSSLKPKNSYFSDIRLLWRLKWTKNSSIFQKIFILKHLKILNETTPFQCLENEVE